MITDPFIENLLHPNKAVQYGVMNFLASFRHSVPPVSRQEKEGKGRKETGVTQGGCVSRSPASRLRKLKSIHSRSIRN